MNEAWEGFFGAGKVGSKYVTIDANGYVAWQENASVADFAAHAKAYATEALSVNDGTIKAESATITFSNLDLGYYLIASDLGALCALDTTNPNATVKEKNDGTTLTKKVSQTSASIGDTVDFTITLTIKKSSEGTVQQSYTVHDKMDAGFTFDAKTANIKVSLNNTELDETYYSVKSPGNEEESSCTFEVEINKGSTQKELNTGDEIVITYKATLNEQATIGEAGNINLAWLDPSYKVQTKTCTWDVDIFKYTATQNADGSTTEKALAGATFTLSKDAADTSETEDNNSTISLVKTADNLYRVATTNDTTAVTTDATGKFTIEGLGAGTYYLTETTSPAGYNQLSKPITIVIAENGQITVDRIAVAEGEPVKVLNQTGNELPSTGGMGTTIFYVVGGVLVVGAGVLLVTRKRMNAKNKPMVEALLSNEAG